MHLCVDGFILFNFNSKANQHKSENELKGGNMFRYTCPNGYVQSFWS